MLAAFTEALRLSPGDPAVLVQRGNVFSDLGRPDEALADEGCDVTSFSSLGMSDRRMVEADYFCEIHFAIRSPLTKQQRLEVARRIADVCAYPFQFDRKLDWWEVIRDPGRLPGFEGRKHLLLCPRLSPDGFDAVEDLDGIVKVLYLLPITPLERRPLLDHGRAALLEYFAENDIDVLKDRSDPPGQVSPDAPLRCRDGQCYHDRHGKSQFVTGA